MLRSVLEAIVTIGFTGIALWLFWKLLPSTWRFICGFGLILVMLYMVSQALEGDVAQGPAPARRPPVAEPAWSATSVVVPVAAPAAVIPRIEATYSLASTVTPMERPR